MSSNFECFIKIRGQTFDLVIKNSSFGFTFDAIYKNVREIVKLATNESIDISTHDFEIFEFLGVVGAPLKRLDQPIKHKSTISIVPKIPPLISSLYNFNTLVTSPLTLPQVSQLLPQQSLHHIQQSLPHPVQQQPIPHRLPSSHQLPQHIPQQNPQFVSQIRQQIRHQRPQQILNHLPQHLPHPRPALSQHLPQQLPPVPVYNQSNQKYQQTSRPNDSQRPHFEPSKRQKPNTPPKGSHSVRQSPQKRPQPIPKPASIRFNFNSNANRRPNLRPNKIFNYSISDESDRSVANNKPKHKDMPPKPVVPKPVPRKQITDPQLIKNESEIKLFHSIVMAVNIGWNFRKNSCHWNKVHQMLSEDTFRRFDINPNMFRQLGPSFCTKKFYNWAHFYVDNYHKLNGLLDEKCQQIFDLLKIVHILDLDQLFHENSPTALKVREISKRTEFKDYYECYLKKVRLKKVNEKQTEPKETVVSVKSSPKKPMPSKTQLKNTVPESRPKFYRDKCRKFEDIEKIIRDVGRSPNIAVPMRVKPKTPQTLRKSDKPLATVVKDMKRNTISNNKQMKAIQSPNSRSSLKTGNTSKISEKVTQKIDKININKTVGPSDPRVKNTPINVNLKEVANKSVKSDVKEKTIELICLD